MANKRKSPEPIESLIHNIYSLNKEYIEDWIESGGDINGEDNDDKVLLFYAIVKGVTELVIVLLECGADVNKTDKYGCTPLYWAAEQLEIMKMLIEYKANIPQSAWEKQSEIVKLLIEYSADVNKAGEYGDIPLYRAINEGHLEIVKLLIEHNANVNKANEFGDTPLYMAAERGYLEIVNLLIKHNANVNKADKYGVTPLYWAVWKGHLEVVKILVEHNADVNDADKFGQTPLYNAAQKGHLGIVKMLIKHNATVYTKTKNGETVLDAAIHWKNQEIIRIVKEAIEIPWIPQRHHLYPPEVRKRIFTVMCLRMKSTQLNRLPKEIVFIILEYVPILL